MKPKTGEILAMATYPSYDLNDPFTITTKETENPEDAANTEETENPENIEDPEVQKANRKAMLENLWRDRNFSSTYEPGSTFKLIVSAAALEEQITTTDKANDFHCEGYTVIEDAVEDDIKIGCAQYAVHGNQTLRGALRNSCNAAFIQLGSRIGKETLYKYFEAFGLFEKTGVKLAGESSSRFHELDKVGQVELAITSFGQRFEITPVQLITAVSAIANDGKLIQPRIVKKAVNTDNGATEEYNTKEVRKVISEKTAKELRDMMKSVVENRESIYGTVAGYSIGGKTGTSEPSTSRPEDGYVVSYTAIAPADEPEVVGLVVVYNVKSEAAYGSRIAAPIMSNILTDVLPYMGIASEKSDTSNVGTTQSQKTTKLIDVTNKTLTEAKKSLENLGFKVVSQEAQNANSVLVKEQVPAKDTVVLEGGTVVLYTEENNVRTSVEVPNLIRKNT